MKHLLGMGLLASSATVAQVEIQLPPEVSRFVEPGTVAIAIEKGDVNGEGEQDYLLVLEHLRDGDKQADDIRDLLVLVRHKKGELKLVARNNTILGCAIMQGSSGSISVTPTGAGFDVEDHIGSASAGGTRRFKFNYARRERTWVLIEVDDESYGDDQSPPEHVQHTQRPYENGLVIRFAEFNGADYSVDCAP
jgi:hypothetical protein